MALAEYDADKIAHDQLIEITERKIKKAITEDNKQQLSISKTELIQLKQSECSIPTKRRLIVNNCTIEKLGELLNQNPNGLLLERDELTGWLKSLSRSDRPEDRGFYLECFSGKQGHSFDRVGRGEVYIASTTLSLIGTIQPGKLKPYIVNAINQSNSDDGLIQRLQLMVFPDMHKKEWVNLDREPNYEAEKRAFNLFNRLNSLGNFEAPELQKMNFSNEAQHIFDDWRSDLENEIRCEDIHPAIESHLTKYRSLLPKLACIIHIADHGPETAVSKEAILKAFHWLDYLKNHAKRVYSYGINQELESAQQILKKRENLSNPFKPRDINNKNWAGLTDGKLIIRAIDVLLDHNYLREEVIKTGGRDSKVYWWNPNI